MLYNIGSNETTSICLYVCNLLPNYIHSSSNYKITNSLFHSLKIQQLFTVLVKHINFKFKILIDLVTIDYYQYQLRFLNVYNILSIVYNQRFFLKTLINKYFKIRSLISIYKNIN